MSSAATTTGPDVLATASDLRLVLGRLVRRLRTVGADGLTASQLSALVHLEEQGPLRLGELARREGVRPPTATRLVDPLVERGLVTRTPDPDDARGVVLTLTRSGRRLLATTRAGRTAELAGAMARLPEQETARLAAAVPALQALLAELARETATTG